MASHQCRRFEGKGVLVTGGASGIGRAAVEAFAREGAVVVFGDEDVERGRLVQDAVRADGGCADFVHADVRRPEDVERLVGAAAESPAGIDVAFNNVGINWFKPLHEIAVEEWDDMFAVNTRSVFLAMKHEVIHMLERGHGAIVVTSSAIADASRPGASAYSASKSALAGIVRSAALEYGPHGIRVNAVAPGTTNTPMVRNMAGPELDDDAWISAAHAWGEAAVPGLRRLATPQEVAAVALALASEDFSFVTGTTVLVDGGMTAAL